MALYLHMDGVDDFLRSPSVTWTEIIMDMSVDHKTSTAQVYIDGRPGVGFTYVLRNTSNNDEHSGFANGVFIDGVSKSSGTQYVPTNQRVVMRAVRNATGTGAITFFSHNNGGQQFVKGNIYNIKIYNGTTLLAHYDMATGTVQDQSGNGRHATLTGGTWLDDGSGGSSGTTHEGYATMKGSGSLSPTASKLSQAQAELSGQSEVSALSAVLRSAQVQMNGVGSLVANPIKLAFAQVIMNGAGTFEATGNVIVYVPGVHEGYAEVKGVGSLLATAYVSQSAQVNFQGAGLLDARPTIWSKHTRWNTPAKITTAWQDVTKPKTTWR